jgi:chromosome segregation ATPase
MRMGRLYSLATALSADIARALYNPASFRRDPMDIEQLSKTVAWLDDERRKDRQEIAALHERLAALAGDYTALLRKVQQFESDLAATNNSLQRIAKIDELLTGYRKEMTRQLEDLEGRRAEADKDNERLRKVERDGLNKSLADLRKIVEGLPRLEREFQSRKEEESRIVRLTAEMQARLAEFNKMVDERNRALVVLEEGRRQDARRITELQTETAELRKRSDDQRGKAEIVEDLARRTEARVGELFIAENERRMTQAQWLDAQAIVQADRERAWAEMQAQVNAAQESLLEYTHRVEQFTETFREMKRAAEEYRQATELIERRVAESAEIQRLAEERFRQDWAAFLADDQKRWSTHMLLRDEQWREHERLTAREQERAETLEEQVAEIQELLRHLQTVDATRMRTLLNVIREMVAEHDQQFVKVR